MATFTLDASVKLLVARRVLVTGAAVSHARASLRAGRVRVVAADAGANLALLRVVRMFVAMTARASLIGAVLNVMRRVAAGAITMAGRLPRAQHREIFVARATGDGLLFGELMRLVAADASHVTAFEQRGGWHDRLGLLVTRHARGQRLGASGVLLLVASRANLVGRLASDRVRGRDVLVTVLARS